MASLAEGIFHDWYPRSSVKVGVIPSTLADGLEIVTKLPAQKWKDMNARDDERRPRGSVAIFKDEMLHRLLGLRRPKIGYRYGRTCSA